MGTKMHGTLPARGEKTQRAAFRTVGNDSECLHLRDSSMSVVRESVTIFDDLGMTILDRHFSFLLSPDPLHSAAVPQHRRETAGLATDPF